jgi:hypothetical protein
MRIPALLAAVLLLATAVAPANLPQNSRFREPVYASDLLDVCGEAVNELDSPPTQANATNVLKFGWCLGWVQGFFERIVEVHTQAKFEEMLAKKENRPVLAPGLADKAYLSICLPPDTRTQDVVRAIVKGLNGAPRYLSEPKNGPVKEVLKKAYPCPVPAAEETKPADAKP